MNNRRAVILAILITALLATSCFTTKNNDQSHGPDDKSLNQPGAEAQHNGAVDQDDIENGDGAREENKDFGVYPGDKAFDFELEDLEGNTVKLSDYLGKVVMITFWQTTCHYCRMELPLLDELYSAYKDGDLAIFAVNVAEDSEKVSRMVEDDGLMLPVLLDKGAVIAKRYLISALPTSYIINRNGLISAFHIGLMEYDEMEAYVEAAFKE
jgi:peroxiredoxin